MAARPSYRHEDREYDAVIIGAGMAGIAAAVSAARHGAAVALVHDRPVLGGNASTEIRVNLEGANGGAHNRFFVESGIAEDLLLENLWRNPTGSADHWSALLLELVLGQDGLELFLSTHVHSIEMRTEPNIGAVRAFTLASERTWRFSAPLFVDATGDATIAYLAGADFMRGEESRQTYDEPLAPEVANDSKLGGTMWFMCKDVGRPVEFVRPAFAREVHPDELRLYRKPDVWDQDPVLGGFWWMEYGGALDTITDNEEVKRVLLAELYGMWDYVKNSPELRDRNRNLDLEWVAAMPGKRESRRVVGDYVLREQDVMDATRFQDAVAFGGWSIDRHPPEGFLDFDHPPSVHLYLPSIYQIPLRSLYSRDVSNLFVAGRDISASHVASCSSRVQLTCVSGGQAVGTALAMCVKGEVLPRELAQSQTAVQRLQDELQRDGHYIPFRPLAADRPPPGTEVRASSEATLRQPDIADTVPLADARMLSLPLSHDRLASVELWVESAVACTLAWRLYGHDATGSWLPGAEHSRGAVELPAAEGGRWVILPLDAEFGEKRPGYVHLAVGSATEGPSLGVSRCRPLGPLSWRSHHDVDARPVDRRAELGWNNPHQSYVVSFWSRADHYWGGPPGPAIAFRTDPVHSPCAPKNVLDPWERPTVTGVHGWASELSDGRTASTKYVFAEPQWLELAFPDQVMPDSLDIYLNSDVDRHLANLWYSYPEGFRAMPTLVCDFDVHAILPDGATRVLANVRDNYHRRVRVPVDTAVKGVRISCLATRGERYASIADIRIGSSYGSPLFPNKEV